MGRFEYAAVLALCLLITLPLEPALGARVYRQPKRLALSLCCVAAVFVAWDVAGARLGHWAYNSAFVTGIGVAGLPVEEYLFFLVVPTCAILAYEAVSLTLDGVDAWLRERLRRTPARRERS